MIEKLPLIRFPERNRNLEFSNSSLKNETLDSLSPCECPLYFLTKVWEWIKSIFFDWFFESIELKKQKITKEIEDFSFKISSTKLLASRKKNQTVAHLFSNLSYVSRKKIKKEMHALLRGVNFSLLTPCSQESFFPLLINALNKLGYKNFQPMKNPTKEACNQLLEIVRKFKKDEFDKVCKVLISKILKYKPCLTLSYKNTKEDLLLLQEGIIIVLNKLRPYVNIEGDTV